MKVMYWCRLPLMRFVWLQGLRRLILFGFPSDAKSLESIPAVGQVCSPQSCAAAALSRLMWRLSLSHVVPASYVLIFMAQAERLLRSNLCPSYSQVAPAFVQSLQALYSVRQFHMGQPHRKHSQLAAMLDRAVLKLAKSLIDLVSTHPWSMLHCGAFQPALEFACGQIVGHQAGSKPFEAFLQRCMLYIHGVVKSPAYKGAQSGSFQVNLSARTQVRAAFQ